MLNGDNIYFDLAAIEFPTDLMPSWIYRTLYASSVTLRSIKNPPHSLALFCYFYAANGPTSENSYYDETVGQKFHINS